MTITLYTEMDDGLFDALANVKLLVCDVDGVFSDGRIYLGNDGEELKAFHRISSLLKNPEKNGIPDIASVPSSMVT